MNENGPIKLRLGKATKTGIGMERSESAPKYRLKPVSKKQRRRNKSLANKRMILMTEQVSQTGTAFCSASDAKWDHECFGDLVLDHVETRNGPNADDYENLQIICAHANTKKGSIRGLDFRTKEMKDRCLELDES